MDQGSSYIDLQFGPKVYSYNSFSSDEKKSSVDYEEAIGYTGFGKYNILIISTCGLCLFSAVNEATVINFVLPSAECDLDLNVVTKGILSSINFIGIVIACSIWGCISDRIGRRKVLMWTSLAAFVCSLCASLMPSFWGIVSFRFLNGFFMSASCAIVYAFLGEFHGDTHRPKAMACISCFVALSGIALPAVAWLLLSHRIEINFLGLTLTSWRLFMFVISLSSLLVSLILTQITESPKYLYHKGETTEALKIIKNIFAINTGWPRNHFPAENLVHKFEESTSLLNYEKDQLFRMPYLKYLFAAAVMAFSVGVVATGLIVWYPDALKRLSYFHNDNTTFCQALSAYFIHIENDKTNKCFDKLDDDIFIQNMFAGVAYLFGYIIWYYMVSIIGNRNFFVICMTISSICLVLIDFATEKIFISILFTIVLALPGVCVGVVSAEILENIPTYYCGIAICMISAASNLGGFLSGAVFGIMLQWNCNLTFVLYSLNLVVAVCLAFVFPNKISR